MTKLIKNWKELSKVPANDKYRIVVGDCCGWILPATDEPDGKGGFTCHCEDDGYILTDDYYCMHVYLSSHTFYGSQYKYSTELLQAHGFDIEIDNWDKEK